MHSLYGPSKRPWSTFFLLNIPAQKRGHVWCDDARIFKMHRTGNNLKKRRNPPLWQHWNTRLRTKVCAVRDCVTGGSKRDEGSDTYTGQTLNSHCVFSAVFAPSRTFSRLPGHDFSRIRTSSHVHAILKRQLVIRGTLSKFASCYASSIA